MPPSALNPSHWADGVPACMGAPAHMDLPAHQGLRVVGFGVRVRLAPGLTPTLPTSAQVHPDTAVLGAVLGLSGAEQRRGGVPGPLC